jgi:hypothetical protein
MFQIRWATFLSSLLATGTAFRAGLRVASPVVCISRHRFAEIVLP